MANFNRNWPAIVGLSSKDRLDLLDTEYAKSNWVFPVKIGILHETGMYVKHVNGWRNLRLFTNLYANS